MDKTKTRFLVSPFMLFVVTFLVLVGYFIFILVFIILPKENLENSTTFTIILMIILFGIVPTMMLIGFSKKYFSIITIDHAGLHKALFSFLFKQDYSWNDIIELKLVYRVDCWLFIGKVSMKGMDYYKLLKHKQVMQMSYRPSVLKAIRRHSNMKIDNFYENECIK